MKFRAAYSARCLQLALKNTGLSVVTSGVALTCSAKGCWNDCWWKVAELRIQFVWKSFACQEHNNVCGENMYYTYMFSIQQLCMLALCQDVCVLLSFYYILVTKLMALFTRGWWFIARLTFRPLWLVIWTLPSFLLNCEIQTQLRSCEFPLSLLWRTKVWKREREIQYLAATLITFHCSDSWWLLY